MNIFDHYLAAKEQASPDYMRYLGNALRVYPGLCCDGNAHHRWEDEEERFHHLIDCIHAEPAFWDAKALFSSLKPYRKTFDARNRFQRHRDVMERIFEKDYRFPYPGMIVAAHTLGLEMQWLSRHGLRETPLLKVKAPPWLGYEYWGERWAGNWDRKRQLFVRRLKRKSNARIHRSRNT